MYFSGRTSKIWTRFNEHARDLGCLTAFSIRGTPASGVQHSHCFPLAARGQRLSGSPHVEIDHDTAGDKKIDVLRDVCLCWDVERFNGNRPKKAIWARLESFCGAAAELCIHIE